MKTILTCPSCGSNRIEKVRRNWQGEYQGHKYTVENLEFHECPDCGEKVYDREAMRAIEAQSPAFSKSSV
ncbi:MAG: type II toxin-antitoxin system MqsA family antitoxin [Thermoguttaceae bacterium]|jgi:YgiT-type zinc finger domain-containing protein